MSLSMNLEVQIGKLSPLSRELIQNHYRLRSSTVFDANLKLANALLAEINLAHVTVGHDILCGSCIPASGLIALQQFRNEWATLGIPRKELDLITTSDLHYRQLTIPYFVDCKTPTAAKNLIDKITWVSSVLGHKFRWDEKNKTLALHYHGHIVTCYIAQDMLNQTWLENTPVELLQEAAKSIVRMDITVCSAYLSSYGAFYKMFSPETWETEARNLLEWTFHEIVHNALRLDKELRNDVPGPEIVSALTAQEASLLNEYFKGANPRNFIDVVQSKYHGARLSKFRSRILHVANIDIDIAWADHCKLQLSELRNLLKFEVEYHPAPELAPWCLCVENLPAIYRKLRKEYKQVLKATESRNSAE